MRLGAPLLVAVCAVLSGCGGKEGALPLPAGKKTFPPLAMRYEGRTLAAWKAIGEDAPAGERAAAAWALAALETEPTAAEPLLRRLLEDPDPSVRLAAVVASGRLAPPSSDLAALVVTQLEAAQEPLRRHARRALARLRAHALEPLGAALGHAKAGVRWGALASLAGIGEDAAEAAARVERMAREDPDADVRRQALFALPHLGPRAVDACVAFLRGGGPSLRLEAAAALARGGPAVVGAMATLLADGDEEIAAQAGGILADFGPRAQPALPALLEALRRAGPVRFNAAEALIAVGGAAVAPLEGLRDAQDEGVAAIARYALERLREP